MIGTEGKVQLSCGSGGKGVVLGPGEAFGEEAVSFGLSDEVKNSKKQLELSKWIDGFDDWVELGYTLWR